MRISPILFLLAATLSVLGAAAHEILGAPKVLAPLADSSLPQDVIWLHHFSWHVGTVAVLVMAALFLAATHARNGRTLAPQSRRWPSCARSWARQIRRRR